jgi:hypothetical protein
MATYKNTSADYTITVADGYGIFTVNAANVVLNGNLTYSGNLTTVDDFIVVAANNTGAITSMGLLAQANATHFGGLRFNTTANTWQISSSVNGAGVGIYSTILTSGSPATAAGSDTQIQFNQGGVLGANTNLTYDYANSRLTLQGVEVYGNIGSTPTYTGNGVAVYNKTIGGGGTGLYVKNSQVNDELVSKSKAIVYGIIF